jgi:nucleoside-diphosphate-sugar epimerase
MPERVIVLGAGGFLGRHAVAALHLNGVDTVAVTRSGQNDSVSCDLAIPEQVEALLNETRADTVLNCAVVADFGSDAFERQFPVNVSLPKLCAEWCARHDAHLIQVSASLVQGSRTEQIDATTPLQPDTDYGRTKLLAENAIITSGAAACLVRIGGIFGDDGPDHLGLNRALRGALVGVRPTLYGAGTARRNYIFVRDAAAGLLQCMEQKMTGIRWLSGSETLTVAQMLQTVCDVLLPGSYPDQKPGEDGTDQVVIPSKEFKPTRTFEQALGDMK